MTKYWSKFFQMSKVSLRNGNGSRKAGTTKYDAHHKVLSQTYGAFADLRRELSTALFADITARMPKKDEYIDSYIALLEEAVHSN